MEQSFQLKGSLFTLSVLQLKSTDIEKIKGHLIQKIRQAPKFFQYAPIVIDLQGVRTADTLDFKGLWALLQKHKLIPIGVRGGTEKLLKQAQEAGFALLLESGQSQREIAHAQDDSPRMNDSTPQRPQKKLESVIITKPIRSGQQIYAQEADLIVISTVSPGAELLADGNIHVYGTLKGRALAGVNGDTNARIFCHELEAELVSIAGQYKIFEDIQPYHDQTAKQIYLDHEQLVISSL